MGELRFLLLSILCAFITPYKAQTGPAGVQNSATCVFWVKANAGTSSTVNATAISSWNDQSGNGINVSQATSAQQPSFASNVMNGFPAVQFDNVSSTNDKLTAADNAILDNTTGYTFFSVTRPQVLDGSARSVVSKRTTVGVDQSFMHFYYTSNRFYTDIQTTNDRYNTAFTFSANTNFLVTQQYDGTLAAASRCRTYVSSSLNVTAAETSSSVPDNNSPLLLGSTDASDGRPFGGYMAEIIIYRTALPAAPRIIVENYLSAKYDIALASNDFYSGDDAAKGNNDFDVAGCGQESGQSSTGFSASACGGLGISLTSGLDNTDYLFAGHALQSNSVLTSDVGGMTGTNNSRWARIWYFDVTNTSTSLNGNITFDFSDAGLASPTLGLSQDYVLLYRAGTSGTWTEISTATSVSGDQIQFNNQTITNDGYYTLGTKNFFASPLPITLADFEVLVNANSIDINWRTSLEKNVNRFELQSADDSGDFSTFETVTPKGVDGKSQTYSVEDTRPLIGTRYYRLKTIDNDLSFDYSSVRAANKQWQGFRIYPKPTQTTVVLEGLVVSDLKLQVLDASGKFFADQSALSILNTKSASIDFSSFPAGTYLLYIKYRGQVRVEKIPVK